MGSGATRGGQRKEEGPWGHGPKRRGQGKEEGPWGQGPKRRKKLQVASGCVPHLKGQQGCQQEGPHHAEGQHFPPTGRSHGVKPTVPSAARASSMSYGGRGGEG